MATRNAVPRADGEGSIGTALKNWLSGFFKWLNIENYIQFVPNGTPSHQEGRLFYDVDSHTLSIYNEHSDVTHNLGQEHLIRVRNETGSTINDGHIVRIDGVEMGTDFPLIVLAIATTADNAHALGMTTSSIENNAYGYVTQLGVVHDIDTSNFLTGNILFLSDTVAGEVTIIKPSIVTLIGVVLKVHASEGSICVSLEEYGAVGADMLKSVYDINDNGIVDLAEDTQKINGTSVDAIGSGDDTKYLRYNESLDKYELFALEGLEEVTEENPIATAKDVFSKYIIADEESTTTSETFQEKVKMTVTAPEPGDYMLMWSVELSSSTANKPALVKIEQDDSIILNQVQYGLVMADAYSCQTGFAKVVMGSGAHTFDMDFSRQAGGGGYTVGIRRARLYLKKTLA